MSIPHCGIGARAGELVIADCHPVVTLCVRALSQALERIVCVGDRAVTGVPGDGARLGQDLAGAVVGPDVDARSVPAVVAEVSVSLPARRPVESSGRGLLFAELRRLQLWLRNLLRKCGCFRLKPIERKCHLGPTVALDANRVHECTRAVE